jgi:hypothetical protein
MQLPKFITLCYVGLGNRINALAGEQAWPCPVGQMKELCT